MTIPGETIATSAAPRCEDCGTMPRIDVYRSAVGFYVGTYCACGPYSRGSGYYRTRAEAQTALHTAAYTR